MKKGTGYEKALKKVQELMEDIEKMSVEKFNKLYARDEKFREECEDIENWRYAKDFIVAFSEEIKEHYSSHGCWPDTELESERRIQRYSLLM